MPVISAELAAFVKELTMEILMVFWFAYFLLIDMKLSLKYEISRLNRKPEEFIKQKQKRKWWKIW